MKSFSQRKGLKLIRSVLQVDSMDDDLRNGLWNVLYIMHLENIDLELELVRIIWSDYFKKPMDRLTFMSGLALSDCNSYFFDCTWYEVYDFVEFLADKSDKTNNVKYMNVCNAIMEREGSAYRFVNGLITQLTSDEEISVIEDALSVHNPLDSVKTHLQRALEMLSDRVSPDYRNSIKESISAVEAISKIITGDSKSTLGKALGEIEKSKIVELHPSLKVAFGSLYSYTSDSAGIRHAIKDDSTVNFEDAKFMLVSCSAFVNYLIAKSSKAGIKL